MKKRELYSFHQCIGKRIAGYDVEITRDAQFESVKLLFDDNTFFKTRIPARTYLPLIDKIEINPLDHEQTK